MSRPSGSLPPLPTFLVIGAQKGGTRWLRENLSRHPDVFIPATELRFFDASYRKGLDAYRRNFARSTGESAVGDCTPGYMMWRADCHALSSRIDEGLPRVRLLAILRDPVDRCFSAFVHHLARHRLPPDADLLETVRRCPPELDELALISGGWYGRSLAPFVRRFGDRLHVLFTEDAARDPSSVYRSALEHIGVASDFRPRGIKRVRFRTRAPRGSSVASGLRRRKLTRDEHLILYEYFDTDIRLLEDLLGVSLARWRPPERATSEAADRALRRRPARLRPDRPAERGRTR